MLVGFHFVMPRDKEFYDAFVKAMELDERGTTAQFIRLAVRDRIQKVFRDHGVLKE